MHEASLFCRRERLHVSGFPVRRPWPARSLNTDHVKHDGVVFAGYFHGDSRLVVPDGADVLPPTREEVSQPDLVCLRAFVLLSGYNVYGYSRKGQRSASPVKHDGSSVPVLGKDSDERNSDEDVVGVVVLRARGHTLI